MMSLQLNGATAKAKERLLGALAVLHTCVRTGTPKINNTRRVLKALLVGSVRYAPNPAPGTLSTWLRTLADEAEAAADAIDEYEAPHVKTVTWGTEVRAFTRKEWREP